jgi:hypothetical protein
LGLEVMPHRQRRVVRILARHEPHRDLGASQLQGAICERLAKTNASNTDWRRRQERGNKS